MEQPDAQTWKRIKLVLADALERAPEQRIAFLEEACAGDEALRAEVESLLAASRQADSFLDGDATRFAASFLPDLLDELPAGVAVPSGKTLEAGRRLGPYRLTGEIARGGMSTVYRAERADGQFERAVAVKVLRRPIEPDRDVRRRFRAEQQILASFSHPQVVHVFDGGVLEDGRPYLVMELVEGRPITDYCEERALSIDERLALFEQVARAVQAAHEHLIVHCDLKPANVLVTDEGTVKLLDFGIAKLLGELPGLEETVPPTRPGAHPMTPEYAAPEQVRSEEVTTATDTYALGALLYELLSGRRLYEIEVRTPYAAAQAACEETPPRPSKTVSGTARSETLRGDLDAITGKALRKDPGERYGTAQALLDELAAYRAGKPVGARQGAWTYRAKKFARRHQAGVATAAAMGVLIISFIAVLMQQQAQTARQRDRAQNEAAKAEQVSSFLVGLFEASDPDETQGETLTARQLLARGTERIEQLETQPSVQAEMLGAIGRAQQGLGRYDTAQALLRRSLQLRRQVHGPQHPGVAAGLHNLAGAFAEERDFEPAVPLYRKALGIRRQSHGENDLKAAETMGALAGALRNMDKPDSAVALARQALAIHRRHQAANHPDIISAERGLAYALRAAGEYDEGAARYRKVLEKERARYGADHPSLAETHNDFAYLLKQQKNYAAAERHYRKALAIRRSVYGPAHPHTLLVMQNLAGTLWEREKYAEVEELARKRVRALREHAPQDSSRLGSALGGLARFLVERQRLAEAVQPMREVHRLSQEHLGEKHLWTIRKGGELGALLKALGRDREADSLLHFNHTYLQAERDSILQHRDSYTRLDTEASIRHMVKVFKQNGLPHLARRYRVLLQQYTPTSGA